MSLFAPKSGLALTWQEDGSCRGLRLERRGSSWQVAATWSAKAASTLAIPATLAAGRSELDPSREAPLACGSGDPDLMIAPLQLPAGLSPENQRQALELALPRLFMSSDLVACLAPGCVLALPRKTWENWLARMAEIRPDLIASPLQALPAFPGCSLRLDDFDCVSSADAALQINGSSGKALADDLGIGCPQGFEATLALALLLLHPKAEDQRRRCIPVPAFLRPTRQYRQGLFRRTSFALAALAAAAAAYHYWQECRRHDRLWAGRLADLQSYTRKVQVPSALQAENLKLLQELADPKNACSSELSRILVETCRQFPQGVTLESIQWSQSGGVARLVLHLSGFGGNPPDPEQMLAPVAGLSGITLNGSGGGPWILSFEVKQ
ncbi:MAG: hypothetical protein RL095_2499 [Verrucomicrobiota bacterium]